MTLSKATFTKVIAAAVAILLAVTALAGCSSNSGSSSSSSSEDKTIKVGATPTPHAEILNQVKDALSKEGYDLQVVEYNDYIQPNTALESGELDANYFQHITYLENFNKENGTHLESAATIHFEPMRIYAGKTKSLSDLQDGATVAVPNDTTNEARALLLLEQEGLITLKSGAGTNATVLDIESNPKNLQIQEVEAAQVPRTVSDVDILVVNCNYALSAGLDASTSLAVESDQGTAAKAYANVIAVKEGNKDSAKIQALVKAVQSDTVKSYIEKEYDGAVIALF
jgi:D-methionine transport system substrate-binding protein